MSWLTILAGLVAIPGYVAAWRGRRRARLIGNLEARVKRLNKDNEALKRDVLARDEIIRKYEAVLAVDEPTDNELSNSLRDGSF